MGLLGLGYIREKARDQVGNPDFFKDLNIDFDYGTYDERLSIINKLKINENNFRINNPMMVINMDHNDIWKEKLELDKARRSSLNMFLNDCDSKIYNPAIKKK